MTAAQKKPFNVSLENFAKRNASDLRNAWGQALPCHVVARNGAIVTVAFDVQPVVGIQLPTVECPILESQYIKLPVKIGDRGITIPADANIAPSAGLGGEAAPFLNRPFNLSSLIFVPIGNSGWSNPDPTASVVTSQDGSSVVIVGNGSITMTKGSSTITVTDSSITIHADSVTIQDSAGTWEFAAHTHSNGGGGYPTGGVIP